MLHEALETLAREGEGDETNTERCDAPPLPAEPPPGAGSTSHAHASAAGTIMPAAGSSGGKVSLASPPVLRGTPTDCGLGGAGGVGVSAGSVGGVGGSVSSSPSVRRNPTDCSEYCSSSSPRRLRQVGSPQISPMCLSPVGSPLASPCRLVRPARVRHHISTGALAGLVALVPCEHVSVHLRRAALAALCAHVDEVGASMQTCRSSGVFEGWCVACGPTQPMALRVQAARSFGVIAMHEGGAAMLEIGGCVRTLVDTLVDAIADATTPPIATTAAVMASADALGGVADGEAGEDAADCSELMGACEVGSPPSSSGSSPSESFRSARSHAEASPPTAAAKPPGAAVGVGAVLSAVMGAVGSRQGSSMSMIEALVGSLTNVAEAGHTLTGQQTFAEPTCLTALVSMVGYASTYNELPSVEGRAWAGARDEMLRASAACGWLLCLLAAPARGGGAPVANALSHPQVLDAIVKHGRSPAPGGQEEAAWALAALSAEGDHSETLARSDACLLLLIELLSSPPLPVKLQAAWALANLALHANALARLTQLPVTPPLVACMITIARRGTADPARLASQPFNIELSDEQVGCFFASPDDETLLHQCTRCLGTLLATEAGRAQLLALRRPATPMNIPTRPFEAAGPSTAEPGPTADLPEIGGASKALSGPSLHGSLWLPAPP